MSFCEIGCIGGSILLDQSGDDLLSLIVCTAGGDMAEVKIDGEYAGYLKNMLEKWIVYGAEDEED